MNTNVVTFDFSHGGTAQSIRMVTIDGKLWAVAADVCRAIGLRDYNGGFGHHLSKLDADERRDTPMKNIGYDRGSRISLISESGLYKLALRAHKSPVAKPFQDWVTRVVLPAIRKDGAYVIGEEKVARGEESEDELVLRAMTALQAKVERFRKERDEAVAAKDEALAAAQEARQAYITLKPKADFVDQYVTALRSGP